MKLFNRIIPILVSLIIFVLVDQIFKTPKQIYLLASISLVIIILSIWQLTDRKLINIKFWHFIITPMLFLASGLSFLSFLESNFVKYFFLLGLVILIWTFLEVVFLKLHFRPKYQAHSLENISTHLNLVTIFLVTSSFFSLIIFLGIIPWILLVIFAIISLLLTYQLIWISDVTLNKGWPYVLVITIAITEIFWAVSFLPSSVYVNGLIVTISYYLMTGLMRNWLLGIREGRVVKRYLIISIVVLLIVLMTAKWF